MHCMLLEVPSQYAAKCLFAYVHVCLTMRSELNSIQYYAKQFHIKNRNLRDRESQSLNTMMSTVSSNNLFSISYSVCFGNIIIVVSGLFRMTITAHMDRSRPSCVHYQHTSMVRLPFKK